MLLVVQFVTAQLRYLLQAERVQFIPIHGLRGIRQARERQALPLCVPDHIH